MSPPNKQKPHECPKCGKNYLLLSSLKTHMLSHVNTKHRCSNCFRTFSDEDTLDLHVCELPKVTHDIHSLSVATKNRLNEHPLKVYSRQFRCSRCSDKFPKKVDLQNHKCSCVSNSITPKSPEILLDNDKTITELACGSLHCNFTLGNNSLIDYFTSHVHTTHVCSYCQRTFPDEETLNNHVCKLAINTSHNLLKDSCKLHQSSTCSEGFLAKGDLKDYITGVNTSSSIGTLSESHNLTLDESTLITVSTSASSNSIHEYQNILDNCTSSNASSRHAYIAVFKSYDCPICSVFFLDIAELNQHMLSYHQEFNANISLNVFNSKSLSHSAEDEPYDLCITIGEGSAECPGAENVMVSSYESKYSEFNKLADSLVSSYDSMFSESKGKHADQFLSCSVCLKIFSNRKKLFDHRRLHRIKKHSCDVCGKTFRAVSYLKVHMNVHSNQRPFKCVNCDRTFKTSASLKKHEIVHKEEKPFKCSICDTSFYYKSALLAHGVVHSQSRPFTCGICEKAFKSSQTMTSHLKTHKSKDISKEKENFVCAICCKAYTNKRNYSNHLKMHSKKFSYICHHCGKGFNVKYFLMQHLRSHTGERPFKCHVCQRTFAHRATLRNHVDIHSDVKRFMCHVCGKRLSQRQALCLHLKSHSGITQFECHTCGKKFSLKCNYKRHLRVHCGEKPHQCSVCLKRFKQREQWTLHIASHINEKEHGCNLCNKWFTHKSSLKNHMSVHSLKKPYTCVNCNKGFTSRGNLKAHLLTHTTEPKYVCPDCGKKLKSKNSWEVHVRKKSEGTFTCQLCPKVLNRRACMHYHKQLHILETQADDTKHKNEGNEVATEKEVHVTQVLEEPEVESIKISEVPAFEEEESVQVYISII